MKSRSQIHIPHLLAISLILFTGQSMAQNPTVVDELYRCLRREFPEVSRGSARTAYDPQSGRNFAWDEDKQAWIDTKTLECVCPLCPASQAAVLIPDYLILDITPSSPILYVDILKADASTAGTPKPSEETQKVEEKKERSWWETLVPALIPEIGIGGGREDRERRFPDDRRR